MAEDVVFGPPSQIEPRPGRQEVETGLRHGSAPFAFQPHLENVFQPVQETHIGRGIIALRLVDIVRAPVGTLLLLRQINVQQFPGAS